MSLKANKIGIVIKLCKFFGLHPIVGIGMFIIDQGLAGFEGVSLLLLLPFTVIAGIIFALASIFIQKAATDDSWMLAMGKGLLLGLITAIPTSVFSYTFLPPTLLGTIALLSNRNSKRTELPSGSHPGPDSGTSY